MNELETILDSLPDSASQLAVLAGAGISLDGPANLLAGWHFMDAVLQRVMPPEVKPEMSQSLISVPKGKWFRPSEYVRFESLMMSLEQSGIDPELRVLDCLDVCEYPNINHFVLAELIRRGAVVMTTNFDRLIEIAYARSAKLGEEPLHVVYEDAEFSADQALNDCRRALWKLHGSLSVAGKSTRTSVQATILQLMWPALRRCKQAFVERVLQARDLIVLGYSGSDDLDLIPLLADTPSERTMLWIDHASPDKAITHRTAEEICTSQKALTQYEVVGRERVFFVKGHPDDSPSEARSRTALVSAPTGMIVKRLKDWYCPGLAPTPVSGQYEFGLEYPKAVKAFFDTWITECAPRAASRYEFAINLFGNRSFRPEFRALSEQLRKIRMDLLARADATPKEQLDCLMERFNSRNFEESTFETDHTMYDALQALIPHLPRELHGTAYRLSACTLWNHDRRQEGEALFQHACKIERELGQLGEELATLTTWQQATNSVRDHLSFNDHRKFNEIARMMGDPIFPDEAFIRLQELSEQTGYKLNLWKHLLESQAMGYVEEDPARKQRMCQEARAMLRAAVDLGDVAGESQARLLLALCLQEAGDYEAAAAHVICLLELGRVIDLGEFGMRGSALLDQMPTDDFVKHVRVPLAASLWT